MTSRDFHPIRRPPAFYFFPCRHRPKPTAQP
uniref:Ubiquitin-like-conjugating enzyme n=1 Tax=Myoviridae sp. ctwVB15 TaxID=2825208 RepID=A0A8S5UNF9_9CAUD|nr:MAG TPA: ubiquitin-like-conjugating enzyme [Myoviridae sp. ctwVB15]